jgi:hypothetical protein
MEDENSVKRRQVSKIFREKFQSSTVQQHHQAYLNHLYENLNHWKSETNDRIRQFIKEKTEEMNQFYVQYCQEMNEKYANINQQIENKNSLSNINDQIENFNIYCQSNTIENCIRLHTKLFSKDQLTENIQLEYILYPNPPLERTVESLESPIQQKTFEPLESPIQEKLIEPLESPIKERTFDRSESSIQERTFDPSESPIQRRTFDPSESSIEERTFETLESPIRGRTFEPLESPIQERTLEPLESIIKKRPESIHSIPTSSRRSPVPVPVDRRSIQDHSKQIVHEDGLILKPQSGPSTEEPFIPLYNSTTPNDYEPKSSTRLYIGNRGTLTPVLVGKDREVSNETEKITEYSIDSIPIAQDKQEQSSNINPDNDITLVRAYKVLIQEENDYQQLSISSSSDHEEEEDDDDDENQSNITKKFNLKNFDQINYSTIMFRECQTEYNCISSSTKRNELIVYNSKLKVLIILQHENYQQCRHRFYLHWPENLSPNISDITYCQNTDQFLISTWDTSHIYLFNRDLLSLNDLGKLSNDLPLRRIHCYQQTIYCILSNNYLLELQTDEDYSSLIIIRKIKLFNPIDHSQDTIYHLLDITCDENYLIIIYSNEYDEINLQSIHRQTKEFHHHLLLDNRQPINQSYIRIESTNSNGNFLYLNGSQQHLKAIDLVNYNKAKITSVMRRHTKPTNICFLKDKRLVILYEEPYFLSVHDLNNRQEVN